MKFLKVLILTASVMSSVVQAEDSPLIVRYLEVANACGVEGKGIDEVGIEEVFAENYEAFEIKSGGVIEKIVTSREALKQRLAKFKMQFGSWTVVKLYEGPSELNAHRFVKNVWYPRGATPLLIGVHVYATADGKQILRIIETVEPYGAVEK